MAIGTDRAGATARSCRRPTRSSRYFRAWATDRLREDADASGSLCLVDPRSIITPAGGGGRHEARSACPGPLHDLRQQGLTRAAQPERPPWSSWREVATRRPARALSTSMRSTRGGRVPAITHRGQRDPCCAGSPRDFVAIGWHTQEHQARRPTIDEEPLPVFVRVRGPARAGAGDRYRSGVASLENWGSTIELRPRAAPEVNGGPVNGRRCEALA